MNKICVLPEPKNADLQKSFDALNKSHHENKAITCEIAHDLGSPIGAIKILVDCLLKKEQSAEVKKILALIKDACISSQALINELLSDNKKPAAITRDKVDMGQLLKYCVNLMQVKADEKKQHLNLETDEILLPVNRQKIGRVVINLITNAIKFSHENTEINIKLKKVKNTLLISVHDRGIGIPGDMKDKMYTVSGNKMRAGTSGEESHGLGLSISSKLVKELKGKLWYESIVGRSTIFYVELPALSND